MDYYTAGLDALAEWGTPGAYEVLLIVDGDQDDSHETVADVLSTATECTVLGYARIEPLDQTRTVNHGGFPPRIEYTCEDPDFGALDPGQAPIAAVLIRVVTDDSDSIPIGWIGVEPIDTGAEVPYVIALAFGGTMGTLSQAAG